VSLLAALTRGDLMLVSSALAIPSPFLALPGVPDRKMPRPHRGTDPVRFRPVAEGSSHL
jgi:hypothetical protein